MVGYQEKHIQEEVKAMICPNSSRIPLYWEFGEEEVSLEKVAATETTLQLLWW